MSPSRGPGPRNLVSRPPAPLPTLMQCHITAVSGGRASVPPTPLESSDTRINSLCSLVGGSILVAGCNDGTTLLSDALTLQPLNSFRNFHGCRQVTATHSPNGLLYAGGQSSVFYSDVHRGIPVRLFGTSGAVSSLSLHPSTDTFVSTGKDGRLILWDLRCPDAVAAGECCCCCCAAALCWCSLAFLSLSCSP
jgi:WD40 repeat protein